MNRSWPQGEISMTKEKIVRIEVSGPDEFGFFLSTELGLSLTKWKP
jgi:hypothetical protein